MAQEITKTESNATVQKLAERIVAYETQEKTALGSLLGFDARDGFWSKLVKSVSPITSGITVAASAFAVASGAPATTAAAPVVLAVAGVAAATAGLAAATINTAVNKNVFADLHDSHEGNLGKFAHYMGIEIANLGMYALVPAVSTLSNNTTELLSRAVVQPLTSLVAGIAITEGFGDQQLRTESAEARALAERAIKSGQSVEQIVAQEQSLNRESTAPSVETPTHAAEKTNHFVNMIESQRVHKEIVLG